MAVGGAIIMIMSRYVCDQCRNEFTLLAERDKARLFAFSHFILAKMSCPHCGGHAIHLHEDCQGRTCGSYNTPEGTYTVCDGCRSFFNCYTGNVDDGTVRGSSKSKELVIKQAEELLAHRKLVDDLNNLRLLREKAARQQFSYSFANGNWYARMGGTIWKLDTNDLGAISGLTWNTKNTAVIKRTLDNKKVPFSLIKTLLSFEVALRGKSA